MGSQEAARADAVKVGRRPNLDTCSVVDRLYLDGGEHDAMLEARWMDFATHATWYVAAARADERFTRALACPTEHECMCYLPAPNLQAPLHRA